MNKKILTLAVIVFWLFLTIVSIIKYEYIFVSGKEVLLKTLPVDPKDLLMGDYVILNYEIGQLPIRYLFYKNGEEVYVTLNKNEQNIAAIREILKTKPENELFIKGKIGKCNTTIPLFRTGRCINYGIESYYVKEGTGKSIEKDLQNGGLVRIVINPNGDAKVKGFVNK